MRHIHRLNQRIALAKGLHTLFAVIDGQFAFQNIGDQRYRVAMKCGGGAGGNRHHGNGDIGRACGGVLNLLADNGLASDQQLLHWIVALVAR